MSLRIVFVQRIIIGLLRARGLFGLLVEDVPSGDGGPRLAGACKHFLGYAVSGRPFSESTASQ
jgi:hypothetical protein